MFSPHYFLFQMVHSLAIVHFTLNHVFSVFPLLYIHPLSLVGKSSCPTSFPLHSPPLLLQGLSVPFGAPAVDHRWPTTLFLVNLCININKLTSLEKRMHSQKQHSEQQHTDYFNFFFGLNWLV